MIDDDIFMIVSLRCSAASMSTTYFLRKWRQEYFIISITGLNETTEYTGICVNMLVRQSELISLILIGN